MLISYAQKIVLCFKDTKMLKLKNGKEEEEMSIMREDDGEDKAPAMDPIPLWVASAINHFSRH